MAHGELYSAEFGVGRQLEALVARIVADHGEHADPARNGAWIADLDGQRVGCVFCVSAEDPEVAQLRILTPSVELRSKDSSIGAARPIRREVIGMRRASNTTSHRAGGDHLVVAGLEAIIDATAGILAAQSLEATLQAMADALAPIVPYTSLVVYEVDWTQRACIPLLATGSYLEQTMRHRPPLDDSATGTAVLSGELVYRGPDDPVLGHVMPGTPVNEVESILVAPLRVGERVHGTLNVWREASDATFVQDVVFTPAEMMLIERFASLAAIAYANSSQREQLRTQALTDELTGLYNRRHCEAVLQTVLEDGRRHHEPTSIAYFDIDAFKSINDAFGHGAGDEALRRFAEILRTHTRSGDLVCRTGGEEFTVVLPRTDAAQARRLAKRINDAVRAARLGPRADLTVSAGVAAAEHSLDDFDRLVQHADGALLLAKRAGRDRVVVADAISA